MLSDKFTINGMIFSITQIFNINYLSDEDVQIIYDMCFSDLIAFTDRDPAANSNTEYVALSYASYYAVLSYRIANYIYKKGHYLHAKLISENAKIKTGIEIHPACTIGKRFVLDHGVGTVTGETCDIEDDCYILQSVILGSAKIANNENGKRHPSIGNNVQPGGFCYHYWKYKNRKQCENITTYHSEKICGDKYKNNKHI